MEFSVRHLAIERKICPGSQSRKYLRTFSVGTHQQKSHQVKNRMQLWQPETRKIGCVIWKVVQCYESFERTGIQF